MRGDVLRLTVEAGGYGLSQPPRNLERSARQRQRDQQMHHIRLPDDSLQQLLVRHGKLHPVHAQDPVYQGTGVPDPDGQVAVGCLPAGGDHRDRVSGIPQVADQIQGGERGAVVRLSHHITDHGDFHGSCPPLRDRLRGFAGQGRQIPAGLPIECVHCSTYLLRVLKHTVNVLPREPGSVSRTGHSLGQTGGIA